MAWELLHGCSVWTRLQQITQEPRYLQCLERPPNLFDHDWQPQPACPADVQPVLKGLRDLGVTDWSLLLVSELCGHGSLADVMKSGRLWDHQLQAPHVNLLLTVLGDLAEGMVRGSSQPLTWCLVA
ncbi:hypothetical protein HaLaN_02516 [Haematococcus lacustris]|uniref:Protein kinase domain-containing protein n=1 Tax=Haematococcus lacustris TaxID=44745 RepID=A0A699YCE3_HAELA|nr:hypothetical protein HaLaN_02516 [Haematococcus lacustris]